MEEMIEFEIDVLKLYSYGMLMRMNIKLGKSVVLFEEVKECYRVTGLLKMAAQVEKKLIIVNENIDNVKLVMTSKESDALESFKFGMEPLSKN